jgi:hypothetical protein
MPCLLQIRLKKVIRLTLPMSRAPPTPTREAAINLNRAGSIGLLCDTWHPSYCRFRPCPDARL